MLWGWSIPSQTISTWSFMSWIINCGPKFGGTVFSYFCVMDGSDLIIMPGHYPRALSRNCRRVSWPRRRLFENWARRELFLSAVSNVNEFNAKSPAQACLLWFQNPVLKLGSQTSAMMNKTVTIFSALNKWQYIPLSFLTSGVVFFSVEVGGKTSKISWLWSLG